MISDNEIYYYKNGKFHRTLHETITSPQRNNFLIICSLGDWSGFRTLEGCEKQLPELENNKREDYFYSVVERL